MSDRVAAVVVTFNRVALLLRCLDALAAQSHQCSATVVIDNASTDGTPDLLAQAGWLGRDDAHYERLGENVGGAGGFATGIELARRTDVDWLWIMDDDCLPAPDALARLLQTPEATHPDTVLLAPTVLGPDGRIQQSHRARRRAGILKPLSDADYDRPSVEIDFCSFVAPLVRADAARATDPPRAEFFIQQDDAEYCRRLGELGRMHAVGSAVVHHLSDAPRTGRRRVRRWNQLRKADTVPLTYEEFWKHLHGLRNHTWIQTVYEKQSLGEHLAFLMRSLLWCALYVERPFRSAPWVVRFVRDGRQGRFDNVPPAQWRNVSWMAPFKRRRDWARSPQLPSRHLYGETTLQPQSASLPRSPGRRSADRGSHGEARRGPPERPPSQQP